MGAFYIDCRISSHSDRNKWIEVAHLLVGRTGSKFSWISDQTLLDAGIARETKSWTLVVANRTQITRPVGFAITEVEGIETTDEIVFAGPGDLRLLGARTLEGLNMRVDAFAKKLVAGGPILASSLE